MVVMLQFVRELYRINRKATDVTEWCQYFLKMHLSLFFCTDRQSRNVLKSDISVWHLIHIVYFLLLSNLRTLPTVFCSRCAWHYIFIEADSPANNNTCTNCCNKLCNLEACRLTLNSAVYLNNFRSCTMVFKWLEIPRGHNFLIQPYECTV